MSLKNAGGVKAGGVRALLVRMLLLERTSAGGEARFGSSRRESIMCENVKKAQNKHTNRHTQNRVPLSILIVSGEILIITRAKFKMNNNNKA